MKLEEKRLHPKQMSVNNKTNIFVLKNIITSIEILMLTVFCRE